MKKIILILISITIVSTASAQQIFSKKGYPILPDSGDWSIGFDAVPFLKYAGNMFNNSDNNAPEANFGKNNPMTFSGLYVVSPKMAYRVKLRIGVSSSLEDTLVQNILSTNTNETVADERKNTATNIAFGAGFQRWKGYNRLKGIYGAEALVSVGTDKTTFTYGNALSNQNPTTTRTAVIKEGTEFGFQIRGFLGIEYFFAPKMSVSAEYGWGPKFNMVGEGEVQTEVWNGSGVDTKIQKTGKSTDFLMDMDNSGGAINLNFYF